MSVCVCSVSCTEDYLVVQKTLETSADDQSQRRHSHSYVVGVAVDKTT